MKIIDIIIFSLCAAGLVYFIIDRFKYRDINVYHDKLERLNELRKLITSVEKENKETENMIHSMNIDSIYENEFTDRVINYRDNEYKLINLKKEKKEIERYIKNFRMYNKNLRV